MKKNDKIAIIGLGYVGLPLAVEFAKKYKVLGYDIDLSRTNELARGNDETLEVTSDDLNSVIQKSPSDIGLSISSNFADLKDYNIYIITVPTPINEFNLPDLKPKEQRDSVKPSALSSPILPAKIFL